MNPEEILKQMIAAAKGAAGGHWQALRAYAEPEFRRLAAAGIQYQTHYAADVAAAAAVSDPEKSAQMKELAGLRLKLGTESLQLAAEAVKDAVAIDAKLAAQDAVNAALKVLYGAINKAIGLPLL